MARKKVCGAESSHAASVREGTAPFRRATARNGQIDSESGENPITQRGSKMSHQGSNPVTGSVMVIGGGIAGMQAALDLADSGYYVYMVEKESSIGGVMAQLDKTFPTNDCAM